MFNWLLRLSRVSYLYDMSSWFILPNDYIFTYSLQWDWFTIVLSCRIHYLLSMPCWVFVSQCFFSSCCLFKWILCFSWCYNMYLMSSRI